MSDESVPRAVLEGLAKAVPEVAPALRKLDVARLDAPVRTLLRSIARGNPLRAQALSGLPPEDLERAVAEGVPRLSDSERSRLVEGLRKAEDASDPAAAIDEALSGLCRSAVVRHTLMTFATSRFGERSALEPGTRIDDRFEVVELVGAGGMSVVYRARGVEKGNEVALKLLKGDLARDAAVVRRFGESARLWASLAHDGIVQVLGVGVAGTVPYIAMEWVEGPTLRALLDERKRLGWSEALPIIHRLLSALAFAHNRGILHLDLKPENVLLPAPDRPKIGDFDLARVMAPAGGLSLLAGAGTPYYMAPEQRTGGDLDRSADVYAAGVMIFELLSGRLPGRHSPSLHEAFGIPRDASLAVEAALDDDPKKRPADGFSLVSSFPYDGRPGYATSPDNWGNEEPLCAEPEPEDPKRLPLLISLGTNAQGYAEFRNRRDGTVLIHIPAGRFLMGSDMGHAHERPVHEVWLDDYLIGRTEVTVAQYLAFCDATGHPRPAQPVSGFAHPDYFTNLTYRTFPVINVSWEDARAYCEWAGVRLPTEAQWEKAAGWVERSGAMRRFPWGLDDPGVSARASCGGEPGSGEYTQSVGAYPSGASPYGALDMGGNAEEWCADWYDADTYASCSPGVRNPLGPSSGRYRVVRGSSWSNDPWGLRTTFRYYNVPSQAYATCGFRAACSLPPSLASRPGRGG